MKNLINGIYKGFKTKSGFNVITFLVVFAVLSLWFYVQVGVTSPGGKVYSPFLVKYFDVSKWATAFIAKSALVLLKLLGFEVYQKHPANVTILHSRGVNILWACLGFRVMSFWVAFVVAHAASWKFKLKWALSGVVLITAINIIRIMLIPVAYYYHWDAFTSLEPHETFNVATYIAIFILLFWFIKRYKRYETVHEPKAEASQPVLVS